MLESKWLTTWLRFVSTPTRFGDQSKMVLTLFIFTEAFKYLLELGRHLTSYKICSWCYAFCSPGCGEPSCSTLLERHSFFSLIIFKLALKTCFFLIAFVSFFFIVIPG